MSLLPANASERGAATPRANDPAGAKRNRANPPPWRAKAASSRNRAGAQEPGSSFTGLARIIHGLRTPWLGLCFIMSFSILAGTSSTGSGLNSPAETNPSAIIARSRE